MKQLGLSRKSIFVKIMVVSVAAILVLYVFSLYVYNSSIRAQKEKLTHQVESMQNQLVESIEHDVARIKSATAKIFLKTDWLAMSFHEGLIRDYGSLQDVLRAQERLEAIRNISPYVYDVYAYFPVWGRTISSLHGFRSYDAEAFHAIMMPLNSPGAQFVYYSNQIYLTSAFRFNAPDYFSLVVQMDKAEIENAMRKLNTIEGSRTFLIRSDTGEIIRSAGSPPEGGLPAFNSRPEPYGTTSVAIDGVRYNCVYRRSSFLGFTLVNLLPEEELNRPLEIYSVLLVIFTAAVVLTIGAIVFYMYRVVGRPMRRLMRAFESMEKGDFGVRLVPDAQDEFAYLYTAFDHMAENTQRLISEVYEKELLVERSRLKHLQAQINPHFLYNSFYTLHRMIKIGDMGNAEVFSARLGRYFQYITRDAEDAVPLQTEVEHAGIYADIMAVRYGGAVNISMGELPGQWGSLLVPRLILQPLIENAFEHGMKQRTGRGIVKVAFEQTDGALAVSVDDNGNGMEDDELEALNRRIGESQGISEVTGLGNIHRRVRIAFGGEGGLAVSKSGLGGTRVTLTLPGKKEEA